MKPEIKRAAGIAPRAAHDANIRKDFIAISPRCNWLSANAITHRAESWLLRRLFPKRFFNRNASLEIDRLTVELEHARAEACR